MMESVWAHEDKGKRERRDCTKKKERKGYLIASLERVKERVATALRGSLSF